MLARHSAHPRSQIRTELHQWIRSFVRFHHPRQPRRIEPVVGRIRLTEKLNDWKAICRCGSGHQLRYDRLDPVIVVTFGLTAPHGFEKPGNTGKPHHLPDHQCCREPEETVTGLNQPLIERGEPFRDSLPLECLKSSQRKVIVFKFRSDFIKPVHTLQSGLQPSESTSLGQPPRVHQLALSFPSPRIPCSTSASPSSMLSPDDRPGPASPFG